MIAVEEARDELIARRERLKRIRDEIAAQESALLAEHDADWQDRATSERQARIIEWVGESQHRQLRAIDAAIARIDAGTWGVCEVCGCRIDPYRLEARPEAVVCSDCATPT